jgi:hypothetical protein
MFCCMSRGDLRLSMRDLDVDKHWFVTFYHLERGPRPISRIDLSAVPVAEASGPHPFWPPSVIRRPRGSDGSGGSGGPHMSATGPVVADAGDGSAPSIGASSASSGPSSTGAGPLVPGVSDAVSLALTSSFLSMRVWPTTHPKRLFIPNPRI